MMSAATASGLPSEEANGSPSASVPQHCEGEARGSCLSLILGRLHDRARKDLRSRQWMHLDSEPNSRQTSAIAVGESSTVLRYPMRCPRRYKVGCRSARPCAAQTAERGPCAFESMQLQAKGWTHLAMPANLERPILAQRLVSYPKAVGKLTHKPQERDGEVRRRQLRPKPCQVWPCLAEAMLANAFARVRPRLADVGNIFAGLGRVWRKDGAELAEGNSQDLWKSMAPTHFGYSPRPQT